MAKQAKKQDTEAVVLVSDMNPPFRDKAFFAINGAILTVLTLIILIPLIYIVACSFSSPSAVAGGKVTLWPVDFSVEGYRRVFTYPNIWVSYGNTFFYTVFGTLINVVITLLCAYPLARKDLPLKKGIMFLFTFTMLFSGGMIPNYILVKSLGMTNTRWAMLLPNALSVYNMIIARTFIMNIPVDLLEAANIDGCNDTQYFFHVVIPLSGTLISMLVLFYAVGHWNSYFNAFLYLYDKDLMPLQIVLREVLIANSINTDSITDESSFTAIVGMSELIKYALIVVASAPILVLYPFLRRYFVKGVMIGSLKG